MDQSTRISAAAVATVFAFWRWNRPFASVCCSCRIIAAVIAATARFLRAVICNLCNTWKSDDDNNALIRYYLLRVTIRSSLFCMDMIKTRLRTEIAFHNGRWFIINEFTKRSVASKFLITFHWGKPYLPLWLLRELIGSFVTNCRYIIERRLFSGYESTMQIIFSPRLKSHESKREETISMSGKIFPVHFRLLPLNGSRRGTEGIINWNRVLCEDSRVKSSRDGLPKRTVAGR